MPKSTLWATPTPAANKIPISEDDGFLADGWIHGNYATVTVVSGDTTLDSTHAIVLVSAGVTISLPTAVGIAGRFYNVIRTGGGMTDFVIIEPSGTETISGDLNLTLTNQWDSCVFVSDGSNWVRCS